MKKLYIITAIIILSLIGAGVLAYIAGNSEAGLFGGDDNKDNSPAVSSIGESTFGKAAKPEDWLAGDVRGKEDGGGNPLGGTDGNVNPDGSTIEENADSKLDPDSPEFDLNPIEKSAKDALLDTDFYPGQDYYEYMAVSPNYRYLVGPGIFDILEGAMFMLIVEPGDGYLDPSLTFYGTGETILSEVDVTVDGIESKQVVVNSGENDTRIITAVFKDGFIHLFNAFYNTANPENYPQTYNEWLANFKFN